MMLFGFIYSFFAFVFIAYAKLSMAPLWAEIMENINRFLVEEDTAYFEDYPPRLALFSAHDTTVMPLLASLGPKLWNDTDWAPYASMMIIEVSLNYPFEFRT